MKIIRKERISFVWKTSKECDAKFFSSPLFPGCFHCFEIRAYQTKIAIYNEVGQNFKVEEGDLLEVNITVRNETKKVKWECKENVEVTKVHSITCLPCQQTPIFVKKIEGKNKQRDYKVALNNQITIMFGEGVAEGFIVKEGDLICVEVDIQVIDNNPKKKKCII